MGHLNPQKGPMAVVQTSRDCSLKFTEFTKGKKNECTHLEMLIFRNKF